MGYTLGQAAKACGMSKTSVLRSIKAGRISAGRDELGQWAIEPCELHRVYPALTDDNDTGTGTGERAVTGGDTALVEANARASLLEQRISDLWTRVGLLGMRSKIPAEIGRHMQCSEGNRTARARRWNCRKRPNAPARFHGVSDLGAD